MRLIATCHAVDVMDTVVITVQLLDYEGAGDGPPVKVFTHKCTLPGVGTDSPRDWLTDALTYLLEEI